MACRQVEGSKQQATSAAEEAAATFFLSFILPRLPALWAGPPTPRVGLAIIRIQNCAKSISGLT